MGREIERKFQVSGDAWRRDVEASRHLRQAYLADTGAASIRVRIVGESSAFLTIKSAAPGRVRAEFEYAIPVADAEALLALRTGQLIEKVRHTVPCGGGDLIVDEFLGANEGLVIAEIELGDENTESVLPSWIGREVTDDPRYYNAGLAQRPFAEWPAEERIRSCPD